MKTMTPSDEFAIGRHYRSETYVAGRVNVAEIEVTKLIPDALIELVSYVGLIAYKAVFRLRDHESGGTEVVCELDFRFRNFVLDLARPAIEAMAQARVKGDLETLRAMLGRKDTLS